MVPPTSNKDEMAIKLESRYQNSMDAVTKGALDGLTLLHNICAMLIVVALVALINAGLGLLPN